MTPKEHIPYSSPTVFIDPMMDTYPISPEAFRVYFHLAARIGGEAGDQPLPTPQSIGDHCFHSEPDPSERASKAERAFNELIKYGLLVKEHAEDHVCYVMVRPPRYEPPREEK